MRLSPGAFNLHHLLEHKTLEVVMRYLAIADADLENAHRKTSAQLR